MEEIWKDIQGYEGLYQVSNIGRVKHLDVIVKRGNNSILPIKEKIIKQNVGTTGYYQVVLWKNNKGVVKKVHRLVAITFIPNPENKRIVDHIDTNPLNNNVFNLRWATDKENCNNEITLLKQRKTKSSKEYRERMKNINSGKSLSCETKQKISKAQKGKRKPKLWKKVRFIEINKTYDSMWMASKETNIDIKQISAVCRGKRKSYKGTHWEFADESVL